MLGVKKTTKSEERINELQIIVDSRCPIIYQH